MKRPQHRARLRVVAGAALTLSTASLALVPAGSALAANAGDQSFSGTVRNYSAYVGAEILNTINARANIGEAVAVADSTGLNKPGYAGTGTGDFAVPGTITADPTARSYGRSAVLGIGFTGLNVQPLKAESHSTTAVDGALESISTPLGNLDIPLLGKLSALTGQADTNWNDTVLTQGGRLAYADSNIATLELLNGIAGLPLPGSLFPVATAELGQNTGEVKLIGDGTACPTGLAVRSEATWDFADVHLLNSFIDISWGGDAGNPGDSAVMAATANGLPGGARVDVPELGDMTVRVGDASLELQPGASIEIDQILKDAGGLLGSTLATFVGGEISYEGVTDITESADGTHAHGALNGLEANLSLLGIPIVAPNGLGSVELGVMRGEVDAIAPTGGLNCTSTGTDTSTDASASTATDTSASTATDTSAATATDTSAATSTATDTSAATATDASAATATDTSAATATDTSAATSTATDTSAATATDTSAATATDTSAATSTATDTSAATATDTSAATATDTSAATSTATDTSAATATDTSAATATDTSAATSTATDTSAATATDTSAATATDTSAATATDTSASTATDTSAATATDTSAATATDTSAATATDTSAATATDTSAATATDTSAATSTATDTSAATATDTSASTATDTSAATATDTSAATSTATDTSAATATDTSAATATDTSAATSTATDTSAATATDTSAATATDTSAATATDTSAATATDTSAATSTATDTSAATATDTSAATSTATDTSASAAADTATQVAPPGTASASTAGASTSGSADVSPPTGLPNTGGVPVQLLALAVGLLLMGGRLLGASRYWQKQAG